LVSLVEKDGAAAAVARVVANNFDKLPVGVRDRLLRRRP